MNNNGGLLYGLLSGAACWRSEKHGLRCSAIYIRNIVKVIKIRVLELLRWICCTQSMNIISMFYIAFCFFPHCFHKLSHSSGLAASAVAPCNVSLAWFEFWHIPETKWLIYSAKMFKYSRTALSLSICSCICKMSAF